MEFNRVYCTDNLKLLQEMDNESVDLIYCDILYNTGKKFKDYDDRLGTPQQAIEWYRPRLIEMKRVLKDSGSIYLQCDYRLVHYLKVEMDEIYGIDSFRNEIIWKYGLGGSGNKEFAKKHDNILFYTKGKAYIFNLQFENATSNKMKGQLKKMTDVWDIPNINNMSKERVGYNTQKPREILERIIKASSSEGDTVADFFCGSGTSMVVSKELRRNYIGCDINPRAVEITNKRLDEVIN